MRTPKTNDLVIKNITSSSVTVLNHALAADAEMIVQRWRVIFEAEVAQELAELAGLNGDKSIEVRLVVGETLPSGVNAALGESLGFTNNRALIGPSKLLQLAGSGTVGQRIVHFLSNRWIPTTTTPIGDPTTPSTTSQYRFDIDNAVSVLFDGELYTEAASNDENLVPGIGVELDGSASVVMPSDGFEMNGTICLVRSYQNGDPTSITDEMIAVFTATVIKDTGTFPTSAEIANAIDAVIEQGRDDQLVSIIPISNVLVQRNAVATIVDTFTNISAKTPFNSLIQS